ncbi:hypothetical protein ACNJYD_10120 [Bradyrhizobium sp. DASA03005]|uniref:hypothetical protein n=1 Tax=Bradyrhizobium sp. SPXBL-02 TaxID=3395912 RepID=UPI003F724384
MDVIDQANASALPPDLHRPSRRFSWILVLLAVSIGLCAGGAYYWTSAEALSGTSSAREAGLSHEEKEALWEIRLGQQKANDQIEKASDGITELNRNMGAQQADLKRMADQIEALTAKIESLQNSPVPTSESAAPSPPAARPVSRPVKRVVQPSKSEGPISIGGAPLIADAGSDQR